MAQLPRLAFLADGGLWNNLGSQVLREDRFIGSHAAWDNGVLRPYGPVPEGTPLLCINGSAAVRPTRPWGFQIPGIALFKSLRQLTEILNANTVLPRVDAMKRPFRRRSWMRTRPDFLDPADMVVDLRPTEEIAEDYTCATWSEELIRQTDPSVKEWEKSALIGVRIAREHAAASPDKDRLSFALGAEPKGSFPLCGLANIDDWDALRLSPAWKQLVEKDGVDRIDAPTTLGRIESGLARRLIARGYLNTYLVSLLLAPLTKDELDRLAQLPERLNKIVGRSGPNGGHDGSK